MKSVSSRVCLLLFAYSLGSVVQAESIDLDVAGFTCRYDARTRVLHALCEGKDVLVTAPAPLVPGPDRKAAALPESSVSLQSTHNDGADSVFEYRFRHGERELPFNITFRVERQSLFMRLSSDSTEWAGAAPARLLDSGPWRRLDVSQYGLAHGQPSYQKATYAPEHALWLWAFWQLESGNCSRWEQAAPQNEGAGPLELAPRALYSPDTAGKRMPLEETLELRIAPRLWQAVPPSSNLPSQHRVELAESVFVDLWHAEPVPDTRHILDVLKAVAGNHVRFYTVLQNWQAGGFDSLLPDSIRMPEYPPNPAVGTVEELAELSRTGASMGRFAFRTNYQLLRDHSPSCLAGEARHALNPDGTPKWHTKQLDLLRLAQRQESEIRTLFAPNAAFTDQLASGGPASSYVDFDAQVEDGVSMRATIQLQRQFAEYLHQVHGGPLGSETLNAEYLLGRWVDTADFGLMGGHERLVSPEYKLRRLHTLTTTHGMGLPYRFRELPPFKEFHQGRSRWRETDVLDDYRCAEILFGNGAYVYMPSMPWNYVLTECLMVGQLQKHYALQPVREIHYWRDGVWTTLEKLVERGFVMHTRPFGKQSPEFARIRVEYENGLQVIVNRSEEVFAVPVAGTELVLPKAGWVARGNGVLAYSAYASGTSHRVDRFEDATAGVRYLDPRGREMDGVTTATMWERRNGSYEVRLTANAEATQVEVAGRILPLVRPGPVPLSDLDFDFSEDACRWRPVAGVRRAEVGPEGWRLWIADPDPQLHSPALRIDADKVSRIVVRFRIDEGALPDGTIGQLYFATEDDPRISEDQVFRFPLDAVAEWQTIELNAAAHPRWPGQIITALRLDPVHGPPNVVITLSRVQGIIETAGL